MIEKALTSASTWDGEEHAANDAKVGQYTKESTR
jgi:hypothetical protein